MSFGYPRKCSPQVNETRVYSEFTTKLEKSLFIASTLPTTNQVKPASATHGALSWRLTSSAVAATGEST